MSAARATAVPPAATLRAMARAGFIVLGDEFGKQVRHWTGRLVKVWYVEDAGPALEHWWSSFEFKGVRYRLRYVSGCFKPFVCREDATMPEWV